LLWWGFRLGVRRVMPQLLPTITSREREGYAKETQIVQDNPNVRGTAGAINATS
jgi:hypothetical protein